MTFGLAAQYVLAAIGALFLLLLALSALADFAPSAPNRIASWWRRWSPWVLRENVRLFCHDMDREDTRDEQDFRYLSATLAGKPDPQKYAVRFSRPDGTLLIKSEDTSGAS